MGSTTVPHRDPQRHALMLVGMRRLTRWLRLLLNCVDDVAPAVVRGQQDGRNAIGGASRRKTRFTVEQSANLRDIARGHRLDKLLFHHSTLLSSLTGPLLSAASSLTSASRIVSAASTKNPRLIRSAVSVG